MFTKLDPQQDKPQCISASGAAQTNAPALPAVADKTGYLEGFDISGGGATAASIVEVTVTGLLGGTIKYALPVVAGATANVNALGGLSVRFPEPLPASDKNTAITVSCPTFGAGNTNAYVNLYGFYR